MVLRGLGVVLETSWGGPGDVLGGLGVSWGGLGRCWGGLQCSWGGLGRSCGGLEESWGALGEILRRSRVPKGRHLGNQNGTKIDPKTTSKFKSEKVASWDRLGSILGRFGACPGGIFIDFPLVFVLFRGHRRFRKKVVARPVLARS